MFAAMDTITLAVPVDRRAAAAAEAALAASGITVPEAVGVFLRHLGAAAPGRPSEAGQPAYNAVTEAAIAEADAIAEGRTPAKDYGSFREFRDDLEAA
jgi:DNA-damage-inducible protein J